MPLVSLRVLETWESALRQWARELNFVFTKLDADNVPALAVVQRTPTITVGAEAADVINVAIQLKNANNANLSYQSACRVWLSDAAGGAVCAVAPSGTVVIGTNGVILDTHTAKLHFVVIGDSNGQFDLNITEAGVKTLYVNVEFQGKIFSSDAVTFA